MTSTLYRSFHSTNQRLIRWPCIPAAMPADPVGKPNSIDMVSSLLTLILVLYTRFGSVSINCVVNGVKNAFFARALRAVSGSRARCDLDNYCYVTA